MALYNIWFLTCGFFHLSWCFKFFYVVACANTYTFLLIGFNCMNILHFVFIHWWKFLLSFFTIGNNLSMNITYMSSVACVFISLKFMRSCQFFPPKWLYYFASPPAVYEVLICTLCHQHLSLSDFLSVPILVGRNSKLFWIKLFFPMSNVVKHHIMCIFFITLISLLKYFLWLN